MNKYKLSMPIVIQKMQDLANRIIAEYGEPLISSKINIYPIPRGGVPVGIGLAFFLPDVFNIVTIPEDADIFVDDLVDSGKTRTLYTEKFKRPFYSLISQWEREELGWIVFPWEQSEDQIDKSVTDNITRILQYIGEDINRGGLVETPRRVIKAYEEWFSGYKVKEEDIPNLLKCFEDGAEGKDNLVSVKDIPFYSHCEHHMAPFFGTVDIAYIPHGKVVGLSSYAD